jgi:hypothetical protein
VKEGDEAQELLEALEDQDGMDRRDFLRRAAMASGVSWLGVPRGGFREASSYTAM